MNQFADLRIRNKDLRQRIYVNVEHAELSLHSKSS